MLCCAVHLFTKYWYEISNHPLFKQEIAFLSFFLITCPWLITVQVLWHWLWFTKLVGLARKRWKKADYSLSKVSFLGWWPEGCRTLRLIHFARQSIAGKPSTSPPKVTPQQIINQESWETDPANNIETPISSTWSELDWSSEQSI